MRNTLVLLLGARCLGAEGTPQIFARSLTGLPQPNITLTSLFNTALLCSARRRRLLRPPQTARSPWSLHPNIAPTGLSNAAQLLGEVLSWSGL